MRFFAASLTAIALLTCYGLSQSAGVRTTVDVVVTHPQVGAVTDLNPKSFVLLEDGAAQNLETVLPPDTPWSILLMFDHNLAWLQTGVFADPRVSVTRISQVVASITSRFLAQIQPRDRVAVAAFEDKIYLLLDWREAQTGRVQQVKLDLNPVGKAGQGRKDFYGAIAWAVTKLKDEKGRKAVIFFTDGRDGRLAPQWLTNDDGEEVFDPLFGLADQGEAEEFAKTLEIVHSSGVRVSFIAVKTDGAPEFRGRRVSGLYPGAEAVIADYITRDRLRLERLATASDGYVLYASYWKEPINAYEFFYDRLQMRSRYTLQYSSQSESDRREIEIRLPQPELKLEYHRTR
jgi:hypothetical protein